MASNPKPGRRVGVSIKLANTTVKLRGTIPAPPPSTRASAPLPLTAPPATGVQPVSGDQAAYGSALPSVDPLLSSDPVPPGPSSSTGLPPSAPTAARDAVAQGSDAVPALRHGAEDAEPVHGASSLLSALSSSTGLPPPAPTVARGAVVQGSDPVAAPHGAEFATSSGPKPKMEMKLEKVFAKQDKIKSEKIAKAKADFETALLKIDSEYSSMLKTAVCEALSSPDVALVYNKKMMDHFAPEGHVYYEVPERVSAIFDKLKKLGILDRCKVFKAHKATSNDLELAHSSVYVDKLMNLSSTLEADAKASLCVSDRDMFFSKGTTDAILFAAGAAIQACELVLQGPFSYSFAIVRPPGHHASYDRASGFCYANNISIAAKHALETHKKERVLIIDRDVHHGDGTQQIFLADKRVMFFSVHRFKEGLNDGFFPGTKDGHLDNIGKDPAIGYVMNVVFMGFRLSRSFRFIGRKK